MCSRLYDHLEKFEILNEHQFIFRQKYKTIVVSAELTKRIRLGYETNMKCSFFNDLKKAFDTLDHAILLLKLEFYEARGNCYLWFKGYLSDRR